MTPGGRLARVVTAVMRRCLPERLAAEAAADLLADYARVRRDRGAVRAAMFLAAEGAGLAAPFAWASGRRLLRSGVLVRRDATLALRSALRRPAATLAAILMLAAGLCAIVTTSALASALLFTPIGRHAERVRRVVASDRAGRTLIPFADVELQPIRDATAGFRTAAVYLLPAVLRAGDADTQTLAEVVTARYFEMAGGDLLLGRPLVDADARPGAPPVIVIGDTIWRDAFGRAPTALGATVRLNNHAFTVVGVAAGGGSGTFFGASVDAWVTTAQADTVLGHDWRVNPDDRFWTMIVESDPADRAALDAALARGAAELARRLPERWRERRLHTVPGTVLAGSQRAAAVSLAALLFAFAALILMAAAANVSGAQLAAAAGDRARAAILMAIGAGRAALVRRHVIEGALLGAAAGAGAVGLYAWIRGQLVMVTVLPTLSLRLDLPLDARLAALTVAAGAACGAVIALGPALWITRLDLAQALRDGSPRAGGGGLSRVRRLLVAGQVAVTVMLLVGASLFSQSVASLETLDVGFAREGLLAMDFDVEPTAPATAAPSNLAREALTRARTLPGVVGAAMSSRAPIDSSTPSVSVTAPGAATRRLDEVTFYLATPGYFDTIGLPVILGRAFAESDTLEGGDVAIVNDTLARHLWPGGDALDRQLTLEPEGRTVRVVGVARDSKYRTLAEGSRPHLYLPAAPGFGMALLVRTTAPPRQTLRALQQALDGVGPGVIGFFPRTLGDHLAIDLLPARAAAAAASALGTLALALSGTGLYGMVMWFVELRRREIGVRLALGATTSAVRRLVVGQAMAAATPGLAAGVALSVALGIWGRTLLVGVGAVDPVAIGTGVGAILAVVAAASFVPSRRATRVDPLTALRES